MVSVDQTARDDSHSNRGRSPPPSSFIAIPPITPPQLQNDGSKKKEETIQTDGDAPDPPPKSNRRSWTTDSSGSGDLKKQIPKAEQKRVDHIPQSTISLAEFRRTRPNLYWYPLRKDDLSCDRHKVKAHHPPDNAEHILLKAAKLRDLPPRNTHKARIKYAKFQKESRRYDEFVAVKVVTGRDDVSRAREEFDKLSQVDHRHIIAALDQYEVRKCFADGTEEIEVGTLLFPLAQTDLEEHLRVLSKHNQEQWLAPSTWKPHKGTSRLVSYIPCLCNALLYLHQLPRPIKHRDIKPANILIDCDNGILLADFDNSKQYDKGGVITKEHTRHTKPYTPPHVKAGLFERGLEWDIISLSYVLVEILTVILGESRLLMLRHFITEPDDDAGYTLAELEKLDVNHGKAHSDGRTATWLDYLSRCPTENSEQVLESKFVSHLDEVVKHIKEMMAATPKDGDAPLRAAYQFFRQFHNCDDCSEVSLSGEDGSSTTSEVGEETNQIGDKLALPPGPGPARLPIVSADDNVTRSNDKQNVETVPPALTPSAPDESQVGRDAFLYGEVTDDRMDQPSTFTTDRPGTPEQPKIMVTSPTFKEENGVLTSNFRSKGRRRSSGPKVVTFSPLTSTNDLPQPSSSDDESLKQSNGSTARSSPALRNGSVVTTCPKSPRDGLAKSAVRNGTKRVRSARPPLRPSASKGGSNALGICPVVESNCQEYRRLNNVELWKHATSRVFKFEHGSIKLAKANTCLRLANNEKGIFFKLPSKRDEKLSLPGGERIELHRFLHRYHKIFRRIFRIRLMFYPCTSPQEYLSHLRLPGRGHLRYPSWTPTG